MSGGQFDFVYLYDCTYNAPPWGARVDELTKSRKLPTLTFFLPMLYGPAVHIEVLGGGDDLEVLAVVKPAVLEGLDDGRAQS